MLVVSDTFENYDGTFPDFEAVNVSAPGAGDGTEFIAALINDGIWGPWQALMSRATMTPNGVVESRSASQIIEAFKKSFAVGPGVGVTYWKNGDPSVNGDRVLLLQGQLVLIASYTELVTACYVGDANNPTAPAFYKCDSGGSRNTAGLYFKLPDTRAVSLKGAGNQTINTRVKSGPAFGAVEEDQMQRWQAGLTISGTTYYGFAIQPDLAAAGQFASGYALPQFGSANQGNAEMITAKSDGTNGTPRTGATTRDCTIGTNFGITY